MRSRTFREGSVGLLLLLGLGVFGIVILWLNRLTVSRSSYKAIVEFANAGGMQKGAVVRYRGVKVGNISAVRPAPNFVEVEIEIVQPDLIMPRDVVVEANQSGLIGEGIIDITPRTSLPSGGVVAAKPLEKNCDSNLIVCNNSRLKGVIGISTDELVRSSTQLAAVYSNQEFYQKVNKAVENASVAAAGVAELSRSLSILSKSTQQQLGSFSSAANSVERAANQLSASTNKTVNQFGTTASQFGTTANQLGTTAKDFSATANQANRLLGNLDNLVTTNRSSLVGTLNSLSQTSNQLRTTVIGLQPSVNRLTQGQLLQNLESLSANAAIASANLRDASKSLNDPNNLVVLQQTLDSARVTFENTQKITSDLDELTGDPSFRQNVRRLVTGLSKLVTSTQQMEQQVQVATTLDSLKKSVNQPGTVITTPEPNQQVMIFSPSPTAFKSFSKQSQAQLTPILHPNSSQQDLLKQLRQAREQRKQSLVEPEQTVFMLTAE